MTKKNSPNPTGLTFFSTAYWLFHQIPLPPIYLYCIEEAERSIGTLFKPQTLVEYSMAVLVTAGRLNCTINGVTSLLGAGDGLVVPINTQFGFESKSTGGFYRKIVLEYKGIALNDWKKTAARPFHLDNWQEWVTRLRYYQKLLNETNAASVNNVAVLIGGMMEFLISCDIAATPIAIRTPAVEKVIEEINLHLEHNYSLDELAKISGCSIATLNRRFRESQGCSINQYIKRRKLEMAERYLKRYELTIKEIAFMLGFCNQFYFSCEFRRKVGCTPTEFRNKITDFREI